MFVCERLGGREAGLASPQQGHFAVYAAPSDFADHKNQRRLLGICLVTPL